MNFQRYKTRIVILLAALSTTFTSGAAGQSGREALISGIQAYDDFDPDEARTISLISIGLDPSGVTDSLWSAGLHRMVQLLMDSGNEELAATWLRWGFRQVPNLQTDPAFPTRVTQAFDSAARFVEPREGDLFARTVWEWTETIGEDSLGAVRVVGGTQRLRVLAVGVGVLSTGEIRSLPAATYEFRASSDGYLSADVSREVLPGVTTLLTFELIDDNHGYLYVGSEPWGTAVLDDREIGFTDIAAHPLGLGQHRLSIERAGYAPFDTTITIAPEQRLRLGTIRLERR